MQYTTYETEDYSDWLNTETLKSRRQIQERLSKIEEEGYFGNHKYLDEEDL
jgi:putative component of toxin-antitoxin plasmid stabilization module